TTPAHIASIREKHTKLEGLLQEEQVRPMPNFSFIQSLKRQKLRLKDQLQSIMRESGRIPFERVQRGAD
ncbi:MAG: DUF465 domain-containing protein, partial [Alphaproteobacteria bacterium]|nr:DUF465 domain-containing protein [Alphaproteobacteria bacterium]